MEGKLKIKCTISCICSVIGVVIIILSLKLKGLSELQMSYMNGFGTSFAVANFALLIKNLRSIKSPKAIRKREIELTDERNVQIVNKSMAITFRICIVLQAILSIVLVFMNSELGMYLGLLICAQIIVYIISNVIVSQKI